MADKKIFVSYSHDGADVAKEVHRHYTRLGYEVFVSEADMLPGENWENRLEDALLNCDVFLLIVTTEALKSKYVKKEFYKAKRLSKPIIPCRDIRIADKDLKWGLAKMHIIDFEDKIEILRTLDNKIDTVLALGIGLIKIDKVYPEMKALKAKGSDRLKFRPSTIAKFRPSIIADIEGDRIIFRSADSRKPTGMVIEGNRLMALDKRSVKQIKTYAKPMLKNLAKWQSVYSKGDPYKDSTAKRLHEIAYKICSDWSKIIHYLGSLGYQLADHYHEVTDVCHQYGFWGYWKK